MIQIGDDVIIKVIQTDSRCVKLGIEAPDNVRVIRAELFGRPGPQHPLAVFLEKRRLERLRTTLSQEAESKIDERRSRIDILPVESAPEPHLHADC
jgi:carbon storage regulator CsrA